MKRGAVLAIAIALAATGCKQPVPPQPDALAVERAKTQAAEQRAQDLEARIGGLEHTVDVLTKQVEAIAASGALGSGSGSAAVSSSTPSAPISKANGRIKNPLEDLGGCTKAEAGGSDCTTK